LVGLVGEQMPEIQSVGRIVAIHSNTGLHRAPYSECVPPTGWRRRCGGLGGAGIAAGKAEERAGAEGWHEDGFWRTGHLRISGQSHWSPCSVRRKIFFAISLALPHPFLSPPDAHLPQFAQKAGT